MEVDYQNPRIRFSALFLFAFGFFLDTGVTHILVQKPRFAEGNPIIRFFMELFGTAGLVGFKLAAFVFIIGIVMLMLDDTERGIIMALVVTGLIWVAAGVWNLLLFGGFVG